MSCSSRAFFLPSLLLFSPPALPHPTLGIPSFSLGFSDHPQVQCVRTYKALQPDELTLEKTDILAVRMRTSDGWLEGVRLADGEKGWVPQAYVEEISSLSARLRNLRENKRVSSATSKLGGPTV